LATGGGFPIEVGAGIILKIDVVLVETIGGSDGRMKMEMEIEVAVHELAGQV